jgi:hypothetical protein
LREPSSSSKPLTLLLLYPPNQNTNLNGKIEVSNSDPVIGVISLRRRRWETVLKSVILSTAPKVLKDSIIEHNSSCSKDKGGTCSPLNSHPPYWPRAREHIPMRRLCAYRSIILPLLHRQTNIASTSSLLLHVTDLAAGGIGR